MGEFHIKRIVLPSGKTVEIVYYQATDGERPAVTDLRDIQAGAELHVRRLELCGGCGGERVHPTEWNEVEEMRWQLALRCPDCEWRHTDTYDAHEVERFDDVLNDATDRLIEELDRVTRENMNEAVDRFRSAYSMISRVPSQQRARGVAAYSSGNHAQAVAIAAAMLDAPAVILMPEDAPAAKLDATR